MVLTKQLEPVHRALVGEGYEMINEVTFRHTATGLFIDLVPVTDEDQRAVFDRAEPTRIQGSMLVDVLTPEGLALMVLREAHRGDPGQRPLRLRDIELLAREPGLDREVLETWAKRMGYASELSAVDGL